MSPATLAKRAIRLSLWHSPKDCITVPGAVIGPGLAATTLHAVEDLPTIWVHPHNRKDRIERGRLLSFNREIDIALIEHEPLPGCLPCYPCYDEPTSKSAWLISPQRNKRLVARKAMIVGRRQNNSQFVIKMRARAVPGFSGSPLLDDKGNLLGILVMYYPDTFEGVVQRVGVDAARSTFRKVKL